MEQNPKNVIGEERKSQVILVVEDDKFLRNIIVKKLKSAGFNVEEATDGKEALAKIREIKPCLVLLDLVLPEIDGFEVLEKMKEDSGISGTKVLVLSNLGQDEDVRRAKDLGAVDFLIKAYFTPAEIVEKVNKVLKEN